MALRRTSGNRTINLIILGLALSFFLIGGSTVQAKTLKASLAQLPVAAENKDKGVLVDVVKAIGKEAGVEMDIQVVPFKKSMQDVETKKVDFHFPLLVNPQTDPSKLNFDYSTATVFRVHFVIYSNKAKNITKSNLKDFNVETEAAHTGFFDFPI
ncbi:MAG: hypothetical protein HQK57_16075, partial [Deltaproteobacteria bacterium]|nr:hypothetical protein [Deltaproteobacteria bacterium]